MEEGNKIESVSAMFLARLFCRVVCRELYRSSSVTDHHPRPVRRLDEGMVNILSLSTCHLLSWLLRDLFISTNIFISTLFAIMRYEGEGRWVKQLPCCVIGSLGSCAS